ncbi:hypothetical protein BKA70DRAFT_1272448 [Coprinopsis sp. MPI-PUGE-AT-0042]|nr:hypothetical protein BKA70DRAFT_1272448 [Coprinopsis sp. MPI-PUGE-AT-0042]
MSTSKPASWSHLWSFTKETFWLGKAEWSPKDMPDLDGKVIIVTGGNAGLGRDTVKALLEHRAKVYIACRDETKARTAIDELEKETGRRALSLKLDLADLASVEECAKEFLRQENRLDILYNNGGVHRTTGPEDPTNLTSDGYDLTFMTNVTGHFYLTQLLLPVLLATANASQSAMHRGDVRIINLSSCGHHAARQPPLDYATLVEGSARRKCPRAEFYYQSKFANILLSNELARRYRDENIVSIAVHPGTFDTGMTSKFVVDWITRILLGPGGLFFQYPREWGAWTQLWAGTAPEAAAMNGKYVIPWGTEGAPRPEANDERMMQELWTWLEARVAEHQAKRSVTPVV